MSKLETGMRIPQALTLASAVVIADPDYGKLKTPLPRVVAATASSRSLDLDRAD